MEDRLLAHLRCPVCMAAVQDTPNGLQCTRHECRAVFPRVRGIPVLLNEGASLYSARDLGRGEAASPEPRPGLARRAARRMLRWQPDLGRNLKAAENYRRFAEMLRSQTGCPRVLVIGGRTVGEGLDTILHDPGMEFVETDVAIGPRTMLVCDAHNIPFADATFDGVIVQAVLEHVPDPARCVSEIHRVLKPGGVLYAEVPFMQQVHGAPYDFTRFTHVGLLRLLRQFAEIDSGAACGPCMAMAWAYRHFLLSFVTSRRARVLVGFFASITVFWLKYLDSWVIDRPASLDSASGYFFMGRRGERSLSDREIVQRYRGGDR